MSKFLSSDTICHKPNSLAKYHSGDLSLQSQYKFGIAFFEVPARAFALTAKYFASLEVPNLFTKTT